MPQSFDGIGNAAAVDFLLVDFAIVLPASASRSSRKRSWSGAGWFSGLKGD